MGANAPQLSPPTNTSLAEPFSQIFVDRDEATWAFDLLLDTVKRLGIRGPDDARFALTLPQQAGKLCLHLNFGQWLVLGFRGPSLTAPRVNIALLANRVAWNERFVTLPSARKEGDPEVRSYHLPLETVRPMTSDLRAAYEATLDFIAGRFRAWKRSPYWKQHNPEIIEALFDSDKRAQLFAGLLAETDLRYERHFTAFHQEIGEEEGEYEVGTTDIEKDISIPYESKNLFQGRIDMRLSQDKIAEMLAMVRQSYPNWSNFANPDFVRDEIDYKQATIAKARELLSEAELKRLITEHKFDEFIERLDKIGKGNNLLWRNIPSSGDLNILYLPDLDKPTFCEAVYDLLYGPGDSPNRLERYVKYIETRQLPNKWTFPTYYLFICHPDTEMFVKPETIRWLLKFFDIPDAYTAKPTPSAYTIIQELAQQLKNELAEYEPKDMVNIQSLIWVCRPDTQKKLAKPFSQIFTSREEAEWAFDFIRQTCERLGIKDSNDQRFALTLPGKRSLRLNFCNWATLSFYNLDYLPYRVHINLVADQTSIIDGYTYKKWGPFARKENEPEICGYDLPIEVIKSPSDELRRVYQTTLEQIARRFKNQNRCPWRNKHHIQAIAEALYDQEKRNKLLDEGLSSQILAAIETKEQETIEKYDQETTYVSPLPLSTLSSDTGLDETELSRWLRAIERKGQAILYGPPGTGKTFVAQKLAQHLVGGGDGFVDLVQFHPAYAYEDFIQGLRPQTRPDGGLDYPLVPGRFLDFCRQAALRCDCCVLIIDEINRANLARVFGELMYLLEYRDQEIPLAGGGVLRLPANVRLIATMNTADRSIALVDHALRRRFAFIELSPNFDILRRYHQKTGYPVEKLVELLTRLNREIADAHYAVGITFFLREDLASQLEDIWRMEIEPYLEEYFFDQPDKVAEFRWEKIKQIFRDVA